MPMISEERDHAVAEQEGERLYGGALARITRLSLLLMLLGLPVTLLRFGGWVALGWVVGGVISWYNFRSLTASVNALGERIVSAHSRESGGGIIAKFLLRYALFAVGAYVIFRISVGSLYGMLAGLFLPVAAALCESAYEAYVALRRGI
jgi:hypothetical protein